MDRNNARRATSSDRYGVGGLVPRQDNHTIIETKWVYRRKLDENDVIMRNKARLVAQSYNQGDGIDFEETFTSIARFEAIRMSLKFTCHMNFKFFKIDMESAFLNAYILEEEYVEQTSKFLRQRFSKLCL